MQALAFIDDRINNLLHKFPFSLPYGGYIDRATGGWANRGTLGVFWLEGTDSAAYARNLFFGGVTVWLEDLSYKTSGFSVRCVANFNTILKQAARQHTKKQPDSLEAIFYKGNL